MRIKDEIAKINQQTKTIEEIRNELEAECARNPGLQCRCPDDSGSCDYCQSADERD